MVVPDIETLGGALIAVSPQLPEHSRELIRRHKLAFDILHDEGSSVIGSFGLEYRMPDYLIELYRMADVHVDRTNGESICRLPLPARYIVDTDRTIRYARVHPDYTSRPEPDETVEALRRLRGE